MNASAVEPRPSRSHRFHRLMHGAVIVLIAAMAIHRISLVLVSPSAYATPSWVAWHSLFLLHGAAMIWLSSAAARRSPDQWYVGVLAAAIVAAMVMGTLKHFINQAAILYLLQVWFVALRFRLRVTLVFALVVGLAFPLVRSLGPDYPFQRMFFEVLYTWSYSAFVIFAASALRSEVEAEKELFQHRMALWAAQVQLEDARILEERLRISRELHDAIGHHLAALSLQLETLRIRAAEPEKSALAEVQELTRAMLTELRRVVGSLPSIRAVDLEHFLQNLAIQVTVPRIQVQVSGAIPFTDSGRNHALLRCAQELVTNCLKHAEAQNLWIEVVCSTESAYLIFKDDGRGAPRLTEGSGLQGLRERLRAFGGRLDLHPGPPGFQARVWIPRAEPAP